MDCLVESTISKCGYKLKWGNYGIWKSEKTLRKIWISG
jgi:hypothetical protein